MTVRSGLSFQSALAFITGAKYVDKSVAFILLVYTEFPAVAKIKKELPAKNAGQPFFSLKKQIAYSSPDSAAPGKPMSFL